MNLKSAIPELLAILLLGQGIRQEARAESPQFQGIDPMPDTSKSMMKRVLSRPNTCAPRIDVLHAERTFLLLQSSRQAGEAVRKHAVPGNFDGAKCLFSEHLALHLDMKATASADSDFTAIHNFIEAL